MSSILFVSTEWIDAWWAQLRGNEVIRTTGATWAHGPIALVVDDQAIRIDMHEGEARDARSIDDAQLELVPTVISGTWKRWQSLIESPNARIIPELLSSHLSMRGDLPTVRRHADLFDELLAAARRVDTIFEAPAEDSVTPAHAGTTA